MTISVENHIESRLRRAASVISRSLEDLRARLPWSVWMVSVLGIVTLVARAPGLIFTGMFDRDESYLAVTGDVLRHGGTLYVDVIDRKPVVVPEIYSFVREWSVDMRAVRLLLALLIFANGVVITEIVRRLTSSRRAALFGGVMAIAGTAMFLPPDAQAANFELWGLLPASAAILFVIIARSARHAPVWFASAGAAVVLAANCKQPYIVVGLVVLFEAWRRVSGRWSSIAATGGGAILATAPFLYVFDGPLMWRWVWSDNSDYLDGGLSVGRAALVGLGLTLVFAALHAPFLYGIWAAATKRVRIDPLITAWTIASFLVIPIGFRFFGHYYQQVIPPLSVMTAVAIVGVSRRVWLSIGSVTAGLFLALTSLSYIHRPDLSNFTALGRYVQQNTTTDQRILVWGALPDVYVSAERRPAGIFLHDGYLTGNWASRAEPLSASAMTSEPFATRWSMFFADVTTDPPELVIDAARPHTDWAEYAPDRFPIGAWLTRCYTRDLVVDGLPVWRRDQQACPS